MNDKILIGKGNDFVNMPADKWKEQLAGAPEFINARLDFMTDEHHLVRYFVVRELPFIGKPLSPEYISENLDMPVEKTIKILDDLEKHLFFLVRNEEGAVSWAFTVTVDKTPHKLVFSTGERLNGA
ncbi:MAG: hypothetical protein GY863_20950 [bacterium]|nr:hypothetical protein [bacterium]